MSSIIHNFFIGGPEFNHRELETMTKKAFLLAKERHAGQVDKEGIDYFYHLYKVAHLSCNLVGESYKDQCLVTTTAFLHDLLEDTNTTFDDLQFAEGIPLLVAEAVLILTRDKNNQTYQEYIDTICKVDKSSEYSRTISQLALVVKFADTLEHLEREENCSPEMIHRYNVAFDKLQRAYEGEVWEADKRNEKGKDTIS